jgi:PLP dependent protein
VADPTAPDPTAVAERLATLRALIDQRSPHPGAVTVVAVTKGFGPEAVAAARAAGLEDLGENYADELVGKAAAAGEGGPPLHWHFLGAVQRNKVARLVPLVACWQGVARPEEGRAIAARRPGATVLVQVEVTGLPGRHGVGMEAVPSLVEALRGEHLDVAGLMTVGPPDDPAASRAAFRSVAALADHLDLPVRSMGMSDDLSVALEEGSTMVRVGRGLFGDRPSRG